MSLTERTARQWILGAVVAGLVLRVAFSTLYWVNKPLTHDEREYLALARSITAGRGFAYDSAEPIGTGQHFGRAPGYPAFLALIGTGTREHDSAPARVKIAQALVGALTIWIIANIARRAAGPGAGVAAALIAAVYPPLVWISSYVLTESLYSAIALLAADTLQRAMTRSTVSRRSLALTVAAGLLSGVAILIRPAMILFLPIAGLWLLARRRTMVAVVLVVAVAAIVGPWTARNARVHGRFILVASEGGITFWTGNHPLARGEGDLAANPDLKQAELEFRRGHPGLSSEELEPIYYRDALAWIASNPGRWLVLLARKALYTVVPAGPSYTLHSTRYWAASAFSYLLLLPLAIFGIRRLWRSSDRPTAVLLLAASAVLVGLIFFPQERFRIPVIDPVLIVAAAAAVAARFVRFAGDAA
jgi:4-amino-4-deoxy-L-arabinose transferase-like glycosyltransferase